MDAFTAVDFDVVNVGGGHVGNFKLPPTAKVIDLKQAIASAGGPPIAFQELTVGGTSLTNDQSIYVTLPTSGSVEISFSLQLPEAEQDFRLEAHWTIEGGSGSLLDDLCLKGTPVNEMQGKHKKGKSSGKGGFKSKGSHVDEEFDFVPSDGRVALGLDPDSGLLLTTHGFDDTTEGFRGPASRLIVIPSSDAPYAITLEADHLLANAVEIHAVQGEAAYPLPPVSFAIALAKRVGTWRFNEWNEYDGSDLDLVEFEFCPGYLRSSRLCTDKGLQFEAACLDRSNFPPRAFGVACRKDGKRYMMMKPLLQGLGEATQLFCISDSVKVAAHNRVTSVAWAAEKKSVLFTVAGSHAVFVHSSHSDDKWQLAAIIGDTTSRGCQDGPLADLRFWFPSSEERQEFASLPLLPGSSGGIFVYSGGVLMEMGSDLASATKVTSVREELWLTDRDEGTPEYPVVGGVFGVHGNKVYRSLVHCTSDHNVHIRRLEASAMLRQPRSQIRKVAPQLWPKIDEQDWPTHKDQRPLHYEEKDRDIYDGNTHWIWDEWLWEDIASSTGEHDKSAQNRIGSTIVGGDGSVWGGVVADEVNVWKLKGGRVAKKATEGEKWWWADDGVGSTIVGPDGSVWGQVFADEGAAWKLDSGRIAKKETEGVKWWWASHAGRDAGAWKESSWHASGWHSGTGGWQGSSGADGSISTRGRTQNRQGKGGWW